MHRLMFVATSFDLFNIVESLSAVTPVKACRPDGVITENS